MSTEFDVADGINYAAKPREEHIDWTNPPSREKRIIAKDQAKFNLTWLVFPEIDDAGVYALPDDYAESMQYMDKVTRQHLLGEPALFIRYWQRIDRGELALAEFMPDDRLERMTRRATEAQDRLFGRLTVGNVVFLNRWRKAS